MISCLQDNDKEMHSAHSEGKSVVAEIFIRTLKKNIYKYMAPISKIMYIDKLADIVNKHYNTYHRTIEMKPIDVKSSTYIDLGIENNDKDSKFKHTHKKLKDNLETWAVLVIFFLELEKSDGGRTEYTSKQRKMVTFVRNC